MGKLNDFIDYFFSSRMIISNYTRRVNYQFLYLNNSARPLVTPGEECVVVTTTRKTLTRADCEAIEKTTEFVGIAALMAATQHRDAIANYEQTEQIILKAPPHGHDIGYNVAFKLVVLPASTDYPARKLLVVRFTPFATTVDPSGPFKMWE